MIFEGQVIKNEKLNEIYLVCHVNMHLKVAALTNLEKVTSSANMSKPKKWRFSKIKKFLDKKDTVVEQYGYPAEMSFTDEELLRQKREKWLKKRDEKFQLIAPLTTENSINHYLYGDGLADEIHELIKINSEKYPDNAWQTTGAYYHAINRYITFGCTVNALLPCRLKNTGSNYFLPDQPGEGNVKRGRGGADNSKSRSKSLGITKLHKDNLKATVAYMKAKENRDW